jgi:hypothetical protein
VQLDTPDSDHRYVAQRSHLQPLLDFAAARCPELPQQAGPWHAQHQQIRSHKRGRPLRRTSNKRGAAEQKRCGVMEGRRAKKKGPTVLVDTQQDPHKSSPGTREARSRETKQGPTDEL